MPYALVDAAMPPITRAGLFHASKIWIDDAHGGAARCRRVALRQRRVAAIVIVGPPRLVNMQANWISRIVRLGPNGCRRQNRRNRQNRQSRNAHQSLLRDIRAESPTKRDAIPHQSAPDAGRQSSHRWLGRCNAGVVKMSQERARKIPVDCSVAVPSSPAACTAPSSRISPNAQCGAVPQWPVGSLLNVSRYSFGRRDVRHMRQHCLGPEHVEHLAAGTLQKAAARLAGSIAWRLQALARIPQRVFPQSLSSRHAWKSV